MRTDTEQLIEEFMEFLRDELGVSDLPEIEFVGRDFGDSESSFGSYDGHTIKVQVEGRHPMDVLRSLAHEVVHHVRQHTDGSDGSADENEANAMAGKFMRIFGKKHPQGFSLLPESVQAFFEGMGPGAEGFEVANQGQVRRLPGEGPDAMGGDSVDQGPIKIEIIPNGVSSDEIRAMFRPLLDSGLDGIYDQIVNAGAFGTIELTRDQANALASVVGSFLDTRKYDRPKKLFAQDIHDQLHNHLNEGIEDAPDVNAMFSQDEFNHPAQDDYSIEDLGNGFSRVIMPNGNEQVLENDRVESYIQWHKGLDWPNEDLPSMKEVFVRENIDLKDMRKAIQKYDFSMDRTGMKDVRTRMNKLMKSSNDEKREHPWATEKQAERIALDHEKEGKKS